MPKEETIVKCRFAGDTEDEFCCNCDGFNPVDDDGTPHPANQCGGYEPEEQKKESTKSETTASHSESGGESCETNSPNKQCTKGITSVIRAESGVSREINGTWFKFTFCEERIVPEDCDIESEKQALWDSVNAEVDAQLEAVRN